MTKIADSAAMRQSMPTRPRVGSSHFSSAALIVVADAFMTVLRYWPYSQSGSSGCLRSQSGRRLLTTGIAAKLYGGGGDVVDHSSVHASHGSFPAGLPLK